MNNVNFKITINCFYVHKYLALFSLFHLRKRNQSKHEKVRVGCSLWQYRLWSFKSRDTKLERFLSKNQHTQSKLLNFENLTNEEPK